MPRSRPEPHPDNELAQFMRKRSVASVLEESMLGQIRAYGLPTPLTQYFIVPGRKFRADLAWPDIRLWMDIQGGQWIRGGGHHGRGSSVEGDAEKISLATIHGWRPLIATTSMIRSGKAIDLLRQALAAYPNARDNAAGPA